MLRTIPSPTSLSIQQTATLLQNLVDLQQSKNGDGAKLVPDHIENCVNKLLKAHTKFVQSIDEYMHLMDSQTSGIPYNRRDEDEFETVSTIVKTCPQFLATKDSNKEIPIHCYIRLGKQLQPNFIPLLAEAGHRIRIGGEKGRGGLLMNMSRETMTLKYLAKISSSTDVWELLKNANPPLLLKEDICKKYLTHYAVYKSRDIESIKYLTEFKKNNR